MAQGLEAIRSLDFLVDFGETQTETWTLGWVHKAGRSQKEVFHLDGQIDKATSVGL